MSAEDKNTQEKMLKLFNALVTINELSDSLYRGVFNNTQDAIFKSDKYPGDAREKAYWWITDNYNSISSAVLAIMTISDYAVDSFPNF